MGLAPRTVLEAKPYILGLAENQEESDARGEADFEEALGVLVFSSVDPMLDIARNQEMYDEVFVEWVSKKADKCEDLEEREALKSLAVMVTETREKLFAVMDAQTAEEAQAVMAGTAGEEGNSNNPNLDTFGDVPMARLDAKGNAVVIEEDSHELRSPWRRTTRPCSTPCAPCSSARRRWTTEGRRGQGRGGGGQTGRGRRAQDLRDAPWRAPDERGPRRDGQREVLRVRLQVPRDL